MPMIRAGVINLEYFVEGEGPPLLMIMGYSGQARTWGAPILKGLREHFTTITFSNRGTGLSDKPDTPTTIDQMADDAAALLDALNLNRVHVFGVSMGGMIAQAMALLHPKRVQGLVLGCTAPGGSHTETASPEVIAMMVPGPGMTREEMVRNAWPAIVTPRFIASHHEFLEEIMTEGFKQPTPLETLGKQMAAINNFDSYERLGQIKAPTLVIHGDADRLVPPSNGERLAKGIPAAEHRTISGVGHMFFWEAPEEAAAMITEFLSRVPAQAS